MKNNHLIPKSIIVLSVLFTGLSVNASDYSDQKMKSIKAKLLKKQREERDIKRKEKARLEANQNKLDRDLKRKASIDKRNQEKLEKKREKDRIMEEKIEASEDRIQTEAISNTKALSKKQAQLKRIKALRAKMNKNKRNKKKRDAKTNDIY